MKKNYSFLFATAVLVLTGCSQDEVLNEVAQKDQAIEFSTYAGRSAESRATSVAAGDKTITNFGVFGFYNNGKSWEQNDEPDFMNNQKVKLNGSEYTYTPLKYWPNTDGHKVSFFAYYPWVAGTTLSSVGPDDDKHRALSFTVEQTVNDQTDFLYTYGGKTIDITKQNINEKVTFTFGHALSRIGFSATYAADELTPTDKPLDSATKIKIKSVTLSSPDLFYKNAKLRLKRSADNNNFAAEWTDQHNEAGIGIEKFELEESNLVETELTSTQRKIDLLNNSDSYIMILPQSFNAKKLKIKVVYDVTTTNDANTSNDGSAFTITNTVEREVEQDSQFEMGKAYTFNLILGMTSVKIDTHVADWTVVNAIDVDVPQNNPNTPTE